jgi:hypothetical protein
VTLDEIRALGLRLAELCQKYGIAELSVFGSIARGDEADPQLAVSRGPARVRDGMSCHGDKSIWPRRATTERFGREIGSGSAESSLVP